MIFVFISCTIDFDIDKILLIFNFSSYGHLKNAKIPKAIAHGFFSKKWLQNHYKFLLHFLIHIDVLILCSKFEPIPTSIFQVTAILKQHPISDYCNPPGSEQKLSTCTGTLYMMLIHGHNVT